MKITRERVTNTWQPVWNDKIEGWTAKQIGKNIWRFDRSEDFDDLMQEAQMLFFTLGQKYPIVNQPAHFFALYKTSLLRRFTDKARLRRKSVIDQDVCVEDVKGDPQVSQLPNCGFLALILDEMPDEMKMVLQALTTGRVRLKLDRPTQASRYRENLNMRLKRQLALTSADPVGDLKAYILNS